MEELKMIEQAIEVAEMVESCEGMVEKKKIEGLNLHKAQNRHYNKALDLFPVLMAKKCLGCPKLDSDDISFRDKRLESKGDKT